ncbi:MULTISPECIES: MFS transporter [Serratia]|jgi:Arabinose efflux permease|uniref:MFS transporter n=1 Tax=Serratia TaxID=613 RepID=UPI000744FE19|nr:MULTISPECIES: MFS transporter [Serratia]APS34936.1 major facilitator transporter [Serratia marcescens]MBH2704085.1 MFS transporter [Serratia marcescens]MBH2958753.1 MFS transporter [Serratia marcescens]MBH3190012.1 MFS transporter [Serratia marcescens]MBN5254275.1 MFS transporter [Serratia marcescens]
MMSMMKEKNLAISSMFFMLGLCFGSLSSRMATIKGGLALSDGVFGSVLFAMSAGVVLSLPISGWAIAKLGSRVVGVAAILINAMLLLLVPFAATVPQLAALLFFSGFAYSAVNVSNNMQASIAEAVSGKTRLPFFHGIWGVAGFVGAGIGALMIGRDVALPLHFVGIAAVALMSALLCRRALFDKPELEQTGRAFAIPDRSLFNYGLIVFCSMACEGIMYDWSVVYFQDVVSVDRKYIGLGFTVFMAAMTIGRLMLNRFVDRIGVRRTLQWGGMLAFIGMTLTTWLPGLVTSIIGFFLVGLGICAIIPLVAGAAARSSSMAPSAAIAAVLTIGFLGTLIGPPLIGFLSETFGLRYAFLVCVALSLGVIYRAGKIPQ